MEEFVLTKGPLESLGMSAYDTTILDVNIYRAAAKKTVSISNLEPSFVTLVVKDS